MVQSGSSRRDFTDQGFSPRRLHRCIGVLPMMSDEGVLPTSHVQLPSSLPDQPGEAITDPRRLNGARLASRRSDRCKLSLIAALIALVQHDWTLLNSLSPHTKLNLEATLSNVS